MILENRRGISAESMKIALAVLLALALFSILIQFATGPRKSTDKVAAIGDGILQHEKYTSIKILNHQ